MRRALLLLCILAFLAAGRLGAQEAKGVARRYDATLYDTAAQQVRSYNIASYNLASVERAGWAAHYGKWLASAAALAFTAMGAHEHDNSNHVFGQLLDMCRADSAACRLAADGRYVNPAAEQLYQASIAYDRRAQVRLLAGQGSLLAAAGLFIADLRHHTSGPGNIPLKVAVDPQTGGARVGVRWSF